MANNYASFTVTPTIPKKYFRNDELSDIVDDLGVDADDIEDMETHDDMAYLYAENGADVDALCDILFSVLQRIPESEIPFIVVEGAEYCSAAMRQGEFGGFAYLITRDDVQSFSTFAWVEEKTKRFRE